MTSPTCFLCRAATNGDRLCPWCRASIGGGFRRETGGFVAGSAGSVTLTNRRIPVADLAASNGDSDRLERSRS
jgi:hypothetical protein